MIQEGRTAGAMDQILRLLRRQIAAAGAKGRFGWWRGQEKGVGGTVQGGHLPPDLKGVEPHEGSGGDRSRSVAVAGSS